MSLRILLSPILVLGMVLSSSPAAAAKKRSQAKKTPAGSKASATSAPTATPTAAPEASSNVRTAPQRTPGKYTNNESIVDRMDGTIMVQHADGSKPTALETNSVIQKGDILNVYERSWVVLKDHKGDRIGLDGGTSVVVDEFYIQGPDRQVRLVLQKGVLLLKVSGCGSRQSFFEVNCGSVVASLNDSQAILGYDAKKDRLRSQYFWGKLSLIDKADEQKQTVEYSEHTWESGKMMEEEPLPVDELDRINFNRFFAGDPRLDAPDNNILLRGNY